MKASIYGDAWLQNTQVRCCSLLQSTDVRWSAAKGLARIAERLQTDMATQVLRAVVELPGPAEVRAVASEQRLCSRLVGIPSHSRLDPHPYPFASITTAVGASIRSD